MNCAREKPEPGFRVVGCQQATWIWGVSVIETEESSWKVTAAGKDTRGPGPAAEHCHNQRLEVHGKLQIGTVHHEVALLLGCCSEKQSRKLICFPRSRE